MFLVSCLLDFSFSLQLQPAHAHAHVQPSAPAARSCSTPASTILAEGESERRSCIVSQPAMLCLIFMTGGFSQRPVGSSCLRAWNLELIGRSVRS